MDFSKALAIMDGSMNDVLMIGFKVIIMITISLLLWFLFAAVAGVVFSKRIIKKPTPTGKLSPSQPQGAAGTASGKGAVYGARQPIKAHGGVKENNNLADTELLTAVKTGNWGTAYQLLKSGASPHGTDHGGRTLLDIAIKNKDKHMIQLLHSHGAESRNPLIR